MDKERSSKKSRENAFKENYEKYFGLKADQRPTEIERQGYFTRYSAYQHETVTYASNTRG